MELSAKVDEFVKKCFKTYRQTDAGRWAGMTGSTFQMQNRQYLPSPVFYFSIVACALQEFMPDWTLTYYYPDVKGFLHITFLPEFCPSVFLHTRFCSKFRTAKDLRAQNE